jgi:hypothetical protein
MELIRHPSLNYYDKRPQERPLITELEARPDVVIREPRQRWLIPDLAGFGDVPDESGSTDIPVIKILRRTLIAKDFGGHFDRSPHRSFHFSSIDHIA